MARNSRIQGVTFTVDDKAFQRAIKRMRANVTDYRRLGAWEVVEEAIFNANEIIFGQVRGPAYSPAYAKWKRANGGGGMLELRGGLREQVTRRTSAQSGSGHGQKITRGKLRFTLQTTWPTAHIHMVGAGRIPARPFLNTESPVFERTMADAWSRVALKWAQDFGRDA